MIGQIAGGKHTGNGCCRAVGLGHHISAHVGLQYVLDQLIGGRMADGNKDAFAGYISDFSGFGVFYFHTFHAQRHIRTIDFINLMEPHRHDFFILQQTVDQDFLGAQLIAPVNQSDFRGEVGQKQSLLHCGIAAANHHDFLTAVEKPVACRTGRDAKSFELFLTVYAKPFCARAGC